MTVKSEDLSVEVIPFNHFVTRKTQMASKAHKILVLHGHGQSAEIIKPKTRYVRDVFSTLSDGIKFEFEYLSGVLPAYPDADDPQDQRVWGYGEPEGDKIKGLDISIRHILDALDQNGPFIGMIGFSSGAAMTAIVTSILEKRRTICDIPWKTHHPQLEFAICLSGFKLRNQYYEAFYCPRISTPMFHAFGELDATVTPTQTEALALDCSYPWFYQFFGGHYVPQIKEYISFRHSLEYFLRNVLSFTAESLGSRGILKTLTPRTMCEGTFVHVQGWSQGTSGEVKVLTQ
ncbi:hypothetical protein N7476_004694 [Penicillium atrosanguineum]|uniref:Serine hydrolase domain-containing protein n=1 Tax=Penicillium atrosanguineum TaxID=1132637 RepID=A0A9W9PY02_9EURO|nr:hypothetical protein N7476_004694 [Penicillium atrosanguineum]